MDAVKESVNVRLRGLQVRNAIGLYMSVWAQIYIHSFAFKILISLMFRYAGDSSDAFTATGNCLEHSGVGWRLGRGVRSHRFLSAAQQHR